MVILCFSYYSYNYTLFTSRLYTNSWQYFPFSSSPWSATSLLPHLKSCVVVQWVAAHLHIYGRQKTFFRRHAWARRLAGQKIAPFGLLPLPKGLSYTPPIDFSSYPSYWPQTVSNIPQRCLVRRSCFLNWWRLYEDGLVDFRRWIHQRSVWKTTSGTLPPTVEHCETQRLA